MSAREDPRALALGVLVKVGRGKFAAPTLDLALSRSGPEPQAAGLATDLVYGTLRRLRWIDWSLKPLLRRPERLPEAVRWALRAGGYEKLFTPRPPHASVNAWVEVAARSHPRLRGLVNAVLRRLEPRPAPEAVRLGLPDFLYEEWRARFGDPGWMEALNEPAPLWLTLYPGGEAELAAQGVPFEAGPVPGNVRIHGFSVRRIAAFRKGLVQPQNPASLLAAQLLEAGPGERVLDLAGGAALKAAWLAARGAQVTSVDADARRQQAGRRNLDRLGLEVAFLTRDLTRPLDLTAPKVLLDAPCLGTGTLRGHPELRMRLEPEALEPTVRLQARLLETAARATEPGGLLVYAVCSLTEAEGEEQIARFLATHPQFEPVEIESPVPLLARGHGVYVRPENGLDGFYYARLRRLS